MGQKTSLKKIAYAFVHGPAEVFQTNDLLKKLEAARSIAQGFARTFFKPMENFMKGYFEGDLAFHHEELLSYHYELEFMSPGEMHILSILNKVDKETNYVTTEHDNLPEFTKEQLTTYPPGNFIWFAHIRKFSDGAIRINWRLSMLDSEGIVLPIIYSFVKDGGRIRLDNERVVPIKELIASFSVNSAVTATEAEV
jgi:hypothetical protein